MRKSKLLTRRLNKDLNAKQNALKSFAGIMGNPNGQLRTGIPNQIYVTIGGTVDVAICTKITPKYGVDVWIGYSAEDPTLYQVLSARGVDPLGDGSTFGTYASAERYRYLSRVGGEDPLWLEKRAWLELRVGMTSPASMSVQVYEGTIWSGLEYIFVPTQNVDLSSYVPSTSGKAALVGISVDVAGQIITIKGNEVDIADLIPVGDEFLNAPGLPSDIYTYDLDTYDVLAYVRVYNGQNSIREGRARAGEDNRGFTDFIDVRYKWRAAGGGGTVESVTGDGVDNTDPANPVLTFPTPAEIGALADVANSVDLANLATQVADTVLANATAGAAAPTAVTVGEQTLVGRITGGHVDDLSTTQVRTLINVEDGAEVNNISDANATTLAGGGANADLLHQHGAGQGWTSGTGTFTSSTLDAPVFLLTTSVDYQGAIHVGDRVELEQGTLKYFIVVAAPTSTVLTLYGGTDYAMVASATTAITAMKYSHQKNPMYFPASPAKWTVTLTDTTQRVRATPTANTWYNLGTLSLSMPIGVWRVRWKVLLQSIDTSGYSSEGCTLSTANNSEVNQKLSGWCLSGSASSGAQGAANVFVEDVITVTTKTTYYCNAKTLSATCANMYFRNDVTNMLLTFECAYL